MDRFYIGEFPIVRIGNRMFRYIKEMGMIMGFDSSLSDIGFKNVGITYRRNIEEDEIDSAYFVNNILGVYHDYKVRVEKYDKDSNQILVVFNSADGFAEGIEPKIDEFDKNNKYYEAFVPENDVKEIYEIRQPEKDFAFESPRIVFHKRDGQWLPWHELGAPLSEDEWI